jgi:[acyl-carrier-protein] S-malonyltransferase
LLIGAAEQLRAYLADVAIQAPSIPVLHNADVVAYNDCDQIRDALVRQLYSPVRWVETVLEFGKLGVTHNAECAPGKVLAGLNKRIDTNQQAYAINDGAALTRALTIFA